MPATYSGYTWSHWLEDGDTNRIKTFTLSSTKTLTAVYTTAPPPPNQPPDSPTFLLQYEFDGPEIPVGGTISGNAASLLGVLSDPDDDRVKLQVELRRLDEYGGSFIGVPTHESEFVDSGYGAIINITGLILGYYHWQARAMDEAGATSDWVSFPQEPVHPPNLESAPDFIVKVRIQINKQGLFGLHVNLVNEGFEEYRVTFEILDGDGAILRVRNHIEIPLFKISEKSFDLPSHKTAEVYVVFDPINKEDLESLEHAKLKFEIVYPGEEVTIENFVGHCFESYKDIVATDFDMTENAYNFSNTELSPPGKCYGMAISCMKNFRSDVVTYDLDKDKAMGDIDFYQRLDGVNYIFGDLLGNRLLEDYNELKKFIKEEELVLFVLVAEEGEKIMHVVVAYKIIESESKAYIFVYDPNYPYYPSNPYPAFCNITYDFGSKEFSYEDYSRIRWVKLPNFFDVMKCGILKSVGELRVYDSQVRVTGLVNGEIRQEIPLSVYVEENETVMIFYPSDTFRYEVVGIGQGTYGLEITSVGYGNTTVFTAINIPTSPNANHQYTIDWVTLSQGEEGVTVKVDSDGDSIFEHVFTSDSELTQSEFLAQITHYTFSIVWGTETFIVSVESNSTVSNFTFNQPDKEISFNVTGLAGTVGFCNVTIPKALLYGDPWTVLIDGTPVPTTITENATHTSLYFKYTHSTHKIQIIGTWVIGPPTPPLSVSISPLSASILVGQSVTFTSTVSGGYTPYSYQWYLNGNPVSGATSTSWTFTPTASGIYYVYLKVTDNKGNTAQSDTARITVTTVPVGGYSIPIQVQTRTQPIIPYIASITILTILFTKLKQKTKRKLKTTQPPPVSKDSRRTSR